MDKIKIDNKTFIIKAVDSDGNEVKFPTKNIDYKIILESEA